MKKDTLSPERLGLNFASYCKSEFGDSIVIVYNKGDAFSWRCSVEDSSRRKQYFNIDVHEACRMQYGNNFKAIVGNPRDPGSWYCIKK